MSDIEFNEEDALESVAEVEEVAKDVVPEEAIETEVQISKARLTIEPTIDKEVGGYVGALPSVVLKEFTEALLKFSEIIKNPDEAAKRWRDNSEEAVNFYTPAGLYQDRFFEKDVQFEQGISNNEGEVTNLISPLKFKNSSGEMKGEMALLKVSKLLGIGEVVNVGLPHSGIWVTIKPPTDKDLIDFYNTVFREKVMLGRSTSGLTFSNFSVYLNNKLFQFILRHIHSVNYSDLPKDQLDDHICIHDFPILAWGFACAMYPNGFPFERACIPKGEEPCLHVSKETINLTKLPWLDNSALSSVQKTIFSENRPNKLTVDSYKKYVAEHSRVVSSMVTVREGIKLKLKIPTFAEYTTDGLAWINGISTSVEAVLLSTEDDEEGKRELINQYVKASVLRQFNHFVDFIEIDDSVVTDRVTINNLLEMFSGEDDLRTVILDAIIKFKSNTTIAVIGIQEYNCPKCGSKQEGALELPRFVNVIPLDSVNLFFLMLTSRISKILEREV